MHFNRDEKLEFQKSGAKVHLIQVENRHKPGNSELEVHFGTT
jgi:hypothetical protein